MSIFTRWGLMGTGRRLALAIGVGSAGTLYYDRPIPSDFDLMRKQWNIWRKEDLADVADEKEGFLLTVGRHIVGYTALLASVLGLEVFSTPVIDKDKHYTSLMDKIRNRSPEQPLLTVSNHASTLDDPGVLFSMLPWDIKLRPALYRCGLCTEEICFSNAFYCTVFGAGKVMPIRRGSGVDQLDLIRFSRRLVAGSWCHIFPEGKTGSIGGNLDRAAGLGKLKWGVGKMVAHCPVHPEIIPIYHTGMQNVIPENPETKECLTNLPLLGETITIQVGKPISVQDLITKHEAVHGKLRKVYPHATDSSIQPSTPEERMLYSAIALRIQSALEDMEKETRRKLGSDYPDYPKVVSTGEWKKMIAVK